jgi:glycosyltransferase involved in cell wall biosynthesis
MKILVLPHEDANPYQRLLYDELSRLGVRIRYAGAVTPSHTANLLLLPLELATARARGWRIMHLHWVFNFSVPGSARFPALRRLNQAWFALCLRTIRLLDMRLVWTVHNVLPHRPVFANDVTARRALVAASDLVIAHSQQALDELAGLGARPRRSAVIPHGPITTGRPSAALRLPGSGPGPRQFLHFGTVQEYKGAEELLAAFAALPPDVAAHLTVAGQCASGRLRAVLAQRARLAPGRVTLQLERVPEAELASLLAQADVVVLPFRRVTTSGSAHLALSHGRPLVVPGLPALADLPEGAVVRYDGTVAGLTTVLADLALADSARLAALSAAARAHAARITWKDIAEATLSELSTIMPGSTRLGRAPAGRAG